MSDGVVLTDESFAKLYRLVHEQKRTITNLKNRLAEYGLRRNQGSGKIHRWGRARLSEELTALGEADAIVWKKVDGVMTKTEETIVVHDEMLPDGGTMAELTRIFWAFDPKARQYIVIGAACDADTSSTVWGE